MELKIIIVNLMTFIRLLGAIILIPIYNFFGGVAVGVTSLICYITDSLDGILARHFKASTFFGALLDGVVDKLFTIVNFIILILITPYAWIPLLIEILIIFLQIFKFNKNLNIKSNIIGKLKVWVLAICVVVTFFVSDISSLAILPSDFRIWIENLPDNIVYFVVLMPAIIMEMLTFLSYLGELCFSQNIEILTEKKEKIPRLKLNKKDYFRYFKDFWLNPEFYEKHKNDTHLRDLRKLSKLK